MPLPNRRENPKIAFTSPDPQMYLRRFWESQWSRESRMLINGSGLHNYRFTVHFISMRHVISALVQNVPGVLSHISGMLASRDYNINSLAVGETEDAKLSRMTFVVVGNEKVQEQVLKQLQKIVTVVKAEDITDQKHVERDLMLMKVEALPGARSKILEMVNIFRGKVVDVSDTTMMIEISGQESKLEGFVDAMRPFGIIELVRSGIIALPRG